MVVTFGAPYEGQVFVTSDGTQLNVTGQVSGLPPNSSHGIHVHQFGDLGNQCMNAGPHYNPQGT